MLSFKTSVKMCRLVKIYTRINSLQHKKSLDWSKLKAFADDNINVYYTRGAWALVSLYRPDFSVTVKRSF